MFRFFGVSYSKAIEMWNDSTKETAELRIQHLRSQATKARDRKLEDALLKQADDLRVKVRDYNDYIQSNRGADSF